MTENTSRLSTALADRYKILSRLGEGGMATVYLAEDIKHNRRVAVKVLRPELAAVLGGERFLQEITTTANLQHPHILPLFDSGEADSFLYYVMPFIDGETLRDKLDRETQLGIDEAVKITSEIADALDYAHRQGVIHRDIKPENILLHDGRPMVADFGIALAVSAAAGGRMTETGLSLGTPHYMSPEQATAEKEITNRSDIYSLGSMLFEMLAGEPPHMGNTAQAIIMKIVTEDAQVITQLRKSVPPNVAAAVAKSLEKLAADRFGTAKEFARSLGDSAFTTMSQTTVVAAGVKGHNHWKSLALGATALAVITTLASIVFARRPVPPATTHRVSVALPEGQQIRHPWVGAPLTLSDDGEVFAYLGEDDGPNWQIWVRRRNELEATPLRGTTSATDPTLSPDGAEIAYTTGADGPLKVISIAGGASRTVVDSANWSGLDWGDDGYLYFTTPENGIARVSSSGGDVEMLTPNPGDLKRHEHVQVLPGAQAAIITILERGTGAEIAVVDFASGEVTTLFPGVQAFFMPTGHLIWTVMSGDLMAATFDTDRLEITGQPVRVAEQLSVGPWGDPYMAVSPSGTLIYQSGPIINKANPVWVSRDGTVEEFAPGWEVPLIRGSEGVAISPDGSKIVIPVFGQLRVDLWVRETGGSPTRLTFESNTARPQWTPDGESVVFLSDRERNREAWVKRTDGSVGEQTIVRDDRQIDEVLYSHDGLWVVYRAGSGAGRDVYAIRPGIDTVATVILGTDSEERSIALSPDDRWLAYVSNEGGDDQIFVTPFPESDSKWQISTDGGTEPVWSRDGSELFYRSSDNQLVAVEVRATATFSPGSRQVLFSTLPYRPDPNHYNYDVHPDGRFLMLRRVEIETAELIWVDNWFEELRAAVGN